MSEIKDKKKIFLRFFDFLIQFSIQLEMKKEYKTLYDSSPQTF